MPQRTERSLTAKQAAACVMRPTAKGAIAVRGDEVLDWAEYDDGSVVVVTTDGQKLTGERPAVKAK